jgi:hypothetical protein
VRNLAAVDVHDDPRLSAGKVSGHHRISVILLIDIRRAGAAENT